MATLFYANQYITTQLSVAGGIDDSQTTGIILQSITGVDDTKPGIIAVTWSDPIDTTKVEYISYTSINSSTKELQGVVRGVDGYSAKSHLNGASIAFPLSESHINNLITELQALPTASSTTTFTNKTLTSPLFQGTIDGWISISGTFTYASATTINVASGAALIYAKGDKLRFQNNDSGTWLYVYVVVVADTLLTVVGNAVPNATLTDAYYSHQSSPLGFPTYFAYTPTISWTASSAPAGSPTKKEVFWIDGAICHVRVKNYGYTAGTAVTGAVVPLPFNIGTQFQSCVGQILIQDALAPISNAYVRNGDVIITVASINASQIDVIADYYY